MIITETSTILTAIQLQKSKLISMKEHLDALLRKKLRIESEITILKKQIKGKLKISETKIKASIHLESSQIVSDSQVEILREEYPDLFSALKEFDLLSSDIEELVKYYDED